MLSGEQLELLAWLRRTAPSLAELYEGAVLMLQSRPPGHVRLIAHAVREIRNRLPEKVSGVKSGGAMSYVNAVDQIARTWREAGLVPSEFADSGKLRIRTTVAVPPAAANTVVQLIRSHEQARSTPQQTARRLFTGVAPENEAVIDALEPVVRLWLETADWFMKHAHDNGRCDEECPRDDLERQFSRFEGTLMGVVRHFYVTVDELDKILEDANS
jgi:hypothetical protein